MHAISANFNASGSCMAQKQKNARYRKTKRSEKNKNCFVELNRTCYVLRIKCQNNEMKNGHTMQLAWVWYTSSLGIYTFLDSSLEICFTHCFENIFVFIFYSILETMLWECMDKSNSPANHRQCLAFKIFQEIEYMFIHLSFHTTVFSILCYTQHSTHNTNNTTAKFATRPENVYLNKFMKLLFWVEIFSFSAARVITLSIHEQTNFCCTCG